MTTMPVISILLVSLYVSAAIWKTRKLPESISAMVYILPKGGWQWLWTIWLIVVNVLTFTPAIRLLDRTGYGFIGFLPMVCLSFVAVWPLFDADHRRWHYILAVIGGIASQFCVFHINPWYLTVWAIWGVMLLWETKDQSIDNWKWSVFLAEGLCFVSLIGAILL